MMYLQSATRGQHKGHVSTFSACLDDFPGTKKSRAVDRLELGTHDGGAKGNCAEDPQSAAAWVQDQA